MGNGTSRVVGCFVPFHNGKNGVDDLDFLEPLDEGLGHSFCYVRPSLLESPAITPSTSERFTVDSSTLDSETLSGSFRHEIWVPVPETSFKTISGASVSANVSTARTGNHAAFFATDVQEPAASFESTSSFAAIPLQPAPHGFMSGPLERGFASGPLDRPPPAAAAFMSGPIEKGVMSGPIDSTDKSNFSAPLARSRRRQGLHRLMRTVGSGWMHRFFLHPMAQLPWHPKDPKFRPDGGPSEGEYRNTHNLQWAHGKAGEDRVHVVLSEQQGWLFIGIYDGFSGPDAPDFLMSHLYRNMDKELEGLLWDYEDKPPPHPLKLDQLKTEKPETSSGCSRPSSKMLSCNLVQPCNQGDTGFESSCSEIVEEKDQGRINVEQHLSNPTKMSILGDASAPTASITGQGRKSKRLYELLQMEPWDGQSSFPMSVQDGKQSQGLYECRTSSCSLVSAQSSQVGQLLSSSSNTKGECSNLRGEDPTTSGIEVDYGHQDAQTSLSGQRQNPRLLFLGSKIRKMYRKQKSLRKKLFRWSYDWHREETCVNEKMAEQIGPIRRCKSGTVDHDLVLKAMARALERTEEAYMEMVEEALDKNPELALMGSCVLVMLMKDQDVYVMNLGDSRVILAQERPNDRHPNPSFVKDDVRHGNRSRESLARMELDRISEESPMHNHNSQVNKINKNREISVCRLKMRAVQLSTDHSTSVEEEVSRIKAEHPDDNQAILNDRVKGQLKVTRAFGAGFLKRPTCNEALLEMFRVDYVGTAPYVSCIPNVVHHRLSSSDRFLVLSSDGLYQYFSNEEVVAHVTWFMENVPEGDPAQYLIAELLFRAAKKNGMDFHELLDIPQGDRRKYHDDVSLMVVSLEGRIWKSSG